MNIWYRRDGSGPYSLDEMRTTGDFDSIFGGGVDAKVANTHVGDVLVSTIFLGVDHQWGDGPPLLFETMVFGGYHDQEQERYTTEEEALVGHQRWVEAVAQEFPADVSNLADLIEESELSHNPLKLAEFLLGRGVRGPVGDDE